MNEKYKAKIEELKVKVKEHGPMIASSVVAGVASTLAVYYRNELVKEQTIDPNEWPILEISPRSMEAIKDGSVFMYREARVGDRIYGQATTDGGFTDEANEKFEEFKNSGEME